MNRIILIGNGFDLAHGLPTRYKDFIDDFWKREVEKMKEAKDVFFYEDEYISLSFRDNSGYISWIVNNKDLKDFDSFILEIERYKKNHSILFSIKNKFLEYITRHVSLKNWVDIESEYHRFLVAISRNERIVYNGVDYNYTDVGSKAVEKLNCDFAQVKKELEKYLKRIQESHQVEPIEEIKEIIYSNFDKMDFTSKGEKIIKKESNFPILPPEVTYGEGKYLNIDDSVTFMRGSVNIKPHYLLFLNFNYTNLEELYLEEHLGVNQEIIHIHGELDTPDNPIIFGYGDEIGEEYAQLEKLNDNNYLENIKSIRYLEADSYKRLLTFVDLSEYQIFIFGHSCGNSDRTLLNTLFEHDNCVSVKFYYWQKDENEDDFSDIIRNISRNFNDKVSMREKVVNKNYSQPLRELK